jgi:hypothetical protein
MVQSLGLGMFPWDPNASIMGHTTSGIYIGFSIAMDSLFRVAVYTSLDRCLFTFIASLRIGALLSSLCRSRLFCLRSGVMFAYDALFLARWAMSCSSVNSLLREAPQLVMFAFVPRVYFECIWSNNRLGQVLLRSMSLPLLHPNSEVSSPTW